MKTKSLLDRAKEDKKRIMKELPKIKELAERDKKEILNKLKKK